MHRARTRREAALSPISTKTFVVFSESFPFGARATLTNNNCNLVEDYLQFKEMGFRRIYFSPVSSFDENIKLDEHSLNKIRAGLIDLADQYLKQIDQGEKPLFRTLKTAVDLIMSNRIAFVGCGAGRRFISVTPEGDVYPLSQVCRDDAIQNGQHRHRN